jgi:hypothetical protein
VLARGALGPDHDVVAVSLAPSVVVGPLVPRHDGDAMPFSERHQV